MHEIWRKTLVSIALCALALAPAAAWADDEDEEVPELQDIEGDAARLEVLQNRKYQLLHEIVLLGGSMPADAYYKGFTGTVGYTLHFGEVFAWEVLQFTYSFNLDTKLKKELLRVAASQGQGEDEFPEITWIAASHLILKPLYGKEALFNTKVVHTEVFLQAGPAFINRSSGTSAGGSSSATGLAFGFDVGFGVRFWLEKWVALRFDILELVYFLDQKPEQALHLHAGFAFNLRGED